MEKKKNKGLIATLVILIVLLLGLGIYTAYDKLVIDKNNKETLDDAKDDLKIANRKYKELEEAKSKLEKDNKETSSLTEKNYIVSTHNENDMHIYAIGNGYLIYTYNEELYISSTNDTSLMEEDGCTSIDNIIASSNPTKSGDGYKTKKLNIKEQDLNKVKIKTIYNSADAISLFYIIKKDGTVQKYTLTAGISSMKNATILNNYKVKDLEIVCNTSSKTCDNPTYKLTLLDGTSKTVTEK